MRIRLVWVGRTRDPACAGWIQEYRRRIGGYCPVEFSEIRDASGPTRAAREARGLLARAGGRGLVVVLDERGREMDSTEFARFLGSALETHTEVTFLLGGPDGLDPELTAEAGDRLSLSRLTFPHEMARVLLAEQIYRALTILRGHPYHRD